jgi:hypothetical protein
MVRTTSIGREFITQRAERLMEDGFNLVGAA